MEIYFKLIHPDVQKQLLDRTEKKMQRLAKLIPADSYETHAYIEITKETGAHHSEAAWRANVRMETRDGRFNATSTQRTPEKAADMAVNEMQSELRNHRARARSISRKADGFWKSLTQGDATTAS